MLVFVDQIDGRSVLITKIAGQVVLLVKLFYLQRLYYGWKVRARRKMFALYSRLLYGGSFANNSFDDAISIFSMRILLSLSQTQNRDRELV